MLLPAQSEELCCNAQGRAVSPRTKCRAVPYSAAAGSVANETPNPPAAQRTRPGCWCFSPVLQHPMCVCLAHLVLPPCRRQAACPAWSSSSGGCGTGTGTPQWPAGLRAAPSPSPPGSSCTSAPGAGSGPSASHRSPPQRCSPPKTALPGTCHNSQCNGLGGRDWGSTHSCSAGGEETQACHPLTWVTLKVPLQLLHRMHFCMAESKAKQNNHPVAAWSPVSWRAQLLTPLCLCCLHGGYFRCCLNVPGQVS